MEITLRRKYFNKLRKKNTLSLKLAAGNKNTHDTFVHKDLFFVENKCF